MEVAHKSWELDNNIQLVDPHRDALYRYDAEAHQAATSGKPWLADRNYFKHVRISAVALIKMVMHARSGGSLEVMGLMQGYIDGDTFIVTDAFRLPVEGTETRVNAQDEANEYMVDYLDASRALGSRAENVIGWYHSHPGYGCWLSGIDVETQSLQQQFNEPFLAVVIDPDRTVSAGKVEIGAFRTFPKTPVDAAGESSNVSEIGIRYDSDGFQAVPLAKAAEFGAHADRYYSLEVSHFKSTLDSRLLELLWHKYWVQTLSASPLLTNRDYGNKQMLDLSARIRDVAGTLTRMGRQAGAGALASLDAGSGASSKARLDTLMDKVSKDSSMIAASEGSSLMASQVKAKIFNSLSSKASCS